MTQTRSSIGRTLTAIMMLAAGSALLISTFAFARYDTSTFKNQLIQRLTVQTQLISATSASAIMFQDADSARTALSALETAPNIIAAEITDRSGKRVAEYHRKGEPVPGPLGTFPAPHFETNTLAVSTEVSYQGQAQGHVTMLSDLSEIGTRERAYLQRAGLVLVASLGIAFIMSRLTQRVISAPIVELARISESIRTSHTYALRAPLTSGPSEIHTLVTTFNQMLDEIEDRNRQLTRAQAELEDRVKKRTSDLNAANKELEAFTYSVSHDLRAPLRHVTGFATMLDEHAGPTLDDVGRRYLKTITAASTKMARLIDDLLAFSRIGRGALNKHQVDLNKIAADAREEVSAHAGPERRVAWNIAPLPTVPADAALMHLVMVNLFSNAVKYTGPRDQALIDVSTTTDNGEVVVSVRDNGVGFDMSYVDKLFGVFQRLHRPDQFEGTGIGLANIKRIVTRHGGRVWATSAPDQGATFSFSLPLKDQ
jgi:signal transduction histidine kinase